MNEWFDSIGQCLRDIPTDAVNDCTRPGVDATDNVLYWIHKLDFTVPRESAVAYLREFGAWDDLDTADDETIAVRVFWTACGDIKDNGEWFGLMN